MARRCILVLALVLCAAPVVRAAEPVPLRYESPGPRVNLAPMSELTFVVEAAGAPARVEILLSRSPETRLGVLEFEIEGGDAKRSPLSGGAHAWQLPAGSSVRREPGTYYWQAVALVDGVEVAGPVRRVEIAFPRAWRKRGRIPRRLGRQGRAAFFVSTSGIPAGVSRARLAALARSAASRWGLRVRGFTSRRAGRRDGTNVVGFGTAVPPEAAAFQVDFRVRRIQVIRRCVARRCTEERRDLGSRLAEQDIVVRSGLRWSDGPGRPDPDQVDLESVLIHELGHMAGNKRHAPRCRNTPMAGGIGPGEWWHNTRDWFRRACPLESSRGLL